MKHLKTIRIRLKNGKVVRGMVLPSKPVLHGRRKSLKPDPIPESMAGQYVVWSSDGLRIKGHGKTIAEARAMASASGCIRQVVQKIPSIRRFHPAKDGVVEIGEIKTPVEPEKV